MRDGFALLIAGDREPISGRGTRIVPSPCSPCRAEGSRTRSGFSESVGIFRKVKPHISIPLFCFGPRLTIRYHRNRSQLVLLRCTNQYVASASDKSR